MHRCRRFWIEAVDALCRAHELKCIYRTVSSKTNVKPSGCSLIERKDAPPYSKGLDAASYLTS